MVLPIIPIAYAAAAVVGRFAAKYGVKKAIQKYGKSKVKSSMRGVKGSKRKQTDSKKSKIDYTSGDKVGTNPAPQQAKPARMPKQKNMQGPKNPKGMGFSAGGKVNNSDLRKKGLFKK